MKAPMHQQNCMFGLDRHIDLRRQETLDLTGISGSRFPSGVCLYPCLCLVWLVLFLHEPIGGEYLARSFIE